MSGPSRVAARPAHRVEPRHIPAPPACITQHHHPPASPTCISPTHHHHPPASAPRPACCPRAQMCPGGRRPPPPCAPGRAVRAGSCGHCCASQTVLEEQQDAAQGCWWASHTSPGGAWAGQAASAHTLGCSSRGVNTGMNTVWRAPRAQRASRLSCDPPPSQQRAASLVCQAGQLPPPAAAPSSRPAPLRGARSQTAVAHHDKAIAIH